jgi:predicted HTH domain antitoxin
MNVTVSIDENIRKELDVLSKEYHVDLSTLLKKLILRGLEFEKRKSVIKLYEDRKISLQKAAELLEISIWEMFELLKRENIHIDYGFEELEEDLEPLINV